MSERSFADRLAAARAPFATSARDDAGLILFYAGSSLWSKAVRLTLAEKGARWQGHEMAIIGRRFDAAHPAYLRLRLDGLEGRPLVDGFAGRDSVRLEGVDPAGVPTLVDMAAERVMVDPLAMCEHIAALPGGTDLVPARLRSEIARETGRIDGTPFDALLYGAQPDRDMRPGAVRDAVRGLHDARIRRLMEGRSLSVGHPRLVAAYDAAIRREAAAKVYGERPDLMRSAASEVEALLGELDSRLGDGRAFVTGSDFTLADVMWAAALAQLAFLGMDVAVAGGKNVAAYEARLLRRDTVRETLDWPNRPAASAKPSSMAQEPLPMPASRRRREPLAGHGRDVREESLTAAVLATFRDTPDPRMKKILNAFTRHLHAFLEEVEPTEAEWEYAIEFLTRTGQLSVGGRQEFILLSDVMGATARVDLINHRFPGGATQNSVLGPFYVTDRPRFDNGADISGGIAGEPMFFNMRVLDTEGRPVTGARVDIWHADGEGGYDILNPDIDEAAMRGLFQSDSAGRVWFISILPASYPIPEDGTVGDLLRAAARSPVRPGHVHVRIEAPGFRRLTTMLFLEGDPYLDADPVFGVKQQLVERFEKRTGVRAPDGRAVPSPAWCVSYDFVLARKDR